MVEYTEEQAKRATWLCTQPITFMRGVNKLADLPPIALNEIAFAGRSNVGKSSLINAILGRKDVARTSNTPGRTQEINFFNLHDRLHIVDLPGYGYARASKTKVADWNDLIRLYLKGRASLKRVFLLVDSRHGLKPNDIAIMDLLDEAAVSYQLILTKTDKIKPPAVASLLARTIEVAATHPAAFPEVLATSSEKRDGLLEVRLAMAQFAILE